jgi:hypothetical protein
MISKAKILALMLFLLLGTPLIEAKKLSKEELRDLLQGMDSPTCFDRVFSYIYNDPETVEEVILWPDPKNIYGRCNGSGFLGRLAYEGRIPVSRYYDIVVQILSRIDEMTTPETLNEERQLFIARCYAFSTKPTSAISIYKGVHSSVGFFISCLKALAKHNMIKRAESLQDMVFELAEVEKNLERDGESYYATGREKLGALLALVESRKNDFTVDSYKVVTQFTRSILAQLKLPD